MPPLVSGGGAFITAGREGGPLYCLLGIHVVCRTELQREVW
jgi:hypothetical protein